jgi:hypothetical protein
MDYDHEAPTNAPACQPHVGNISRRTRAVASGRVWRRSPVTDSIDDRDASIASPSEARYQPSDATRVTSRESSVRTDSLYRNPYGAGNRGAFCGLQQDMADHVRNEMPPPPVPQETFCKSLLTYIHILSLLTLLVRGEKIGLETPDWDKDFPGSHDVYRARGKDDTYVFERKPSDKNDNGKSKDTNAGSSTAAPRRRSARLNPHRKQLSASSIRPSFLADLYTGSHMTQ